jgi:serine/threonine-protein kinase
LLTAQGIVQGTPAFMAPEIVSGERVDGRADLYSLACSAYWALTGRPLFQATTPGQMLLHHVQTTPVPPSQVSELPVPAAFEAVLMTCLEKDPARRPSTALELDQQLGRVTFRHPWTEDRARAWWESHVPTLVSRDLRSR